MALVGGAAVISGRPAARLAAVLDRLLAEHRRQGVQVDPEVAAAVSALREAGQASTRAFPSPTETAPICPSPSLLTADEVGHVLNLTARRVLQLRARGDLRAVSERPYLFRRDDVEALAASRKDSQP